MTCKFKKTVLLKLILIFIFLSKASLSAGLDRILERLDLSGFFRIRSWSVMSKTYVPEKFNSRDTYRHINYFDLFFRNRLNIKIIPEVEIKTVFDISSKFGKSDFAIGSGGTNLITRNVYAVFRPLKGSEFSIGLRPFSLSGGYIIARDATGFQYKHSFFKKKFNPFIAYIKAYDDADDSFGQGSDQPDYIWDDIFIIGAKFNIRSVFSGELYYVYEDDRYTSGIATSGDIRKGSLNWIGLHNKLMLGNWYLRLGGILNLGYMYIRDINNNFRKINVKAGLLEFETGYKFTNLQMSLIAEGATGDPDNENEGISFQDIKASHGFSYIVVDNKGGLALRGSGESSWYGLYGGGLKLQYTLLDSVILKLKLLHFRTTKTLYWRGKGTTWFGDEVDLSAEYKYRDIVSVFLTGGGFLPQRAYNAQESMNIDWWGNLREEYQTLLGGVDPLQQYRTLLCDYDNHSSKSMIFEIMIGVKITYD